MSVAQLFSSESPPAGVRWFSRVLGLGHSQEYGDPSQIVFTYEELKRLSSAAAASAK